jgi:integrase
VLDQASAGAKGVARLHDFDAFEKLVTAAKQLDPRTHVIVLLRGEAGLRCGETLALNWSDIDRPIHLRAARFRLR